MMRAAVITLALWLSPLAHAQLIEDTGPTVLTLLSGDSLRDAFAGRTMDGTYKEFRQRSGTSHFTETFTKDGKTIYREGTITDTGEWKLVSDDVICFRYDGPLAGGVSCFTVFIEGTCLYSFHPSRVQDGQPIDNNQWSAKTVIRGELSTCDDLIG
ncbi:hypothetical protein [Fretibacter rubidus]|uniref:hypothetical protein n=1 Tax=Fretibacter rubidus TaxID=570162 RepID=UPI00352B07D9